jgi:hypothetical protein
MLNDSNDAARPRTQSHEYIAGILADLAMQHDIQPSIKHVPLAVSHTTGIPIVKPMKNYELMYEKVMKKYDKVCKSMT